jgi:hypothetical protein
MSPAFPALPARYAIWLAPLGWLAAAAAPAGAAEPITVTLASGRQVTAHVDASTDQQRLWLRSGDETIVLLRPVEWPSVQSALVGGRMCTRDELRVLAAQLATPSPDHAAAAPSRAALPSTDSSSLRVPDPPPRVRSVSFDVQLANWDADVETDGLLVHVYPLDDAGALVPTGGQLEVTLFAPRRAAFAEVPHGRGVAFSRLAHWSQPVSGDDVLHENSIKLGFQASHPEFETGWASHGLVHLRLAIAGQGIFDDSQDAVRIRPFAPLRDSLERSHGERFFPEEKTGRGGP